MTCGMRSHHDTEEEIMLHKQEFDDIDTDSDGRLQWVRCLRAAVPHAWPTRLRAG